GTTEPHTPETLAQLFAAAWQMATSLPTDGAGHDEAALLCLARANAVSSSLESPSLPDSGARTPTDSPRPRYAGDEGKMPAARAPLTPGDVMLIALLLTGGDWLPPVDDLKRLWFSARRSAPRRRLGLFPVRRRLLQGRQRPVRRLGIAFR